MNNNTLKSVLDNLKSKKASERQEGLQAIRNVFAKDKVVANFHLGKGDNGKTNPVLWLPVYQALFTTVFLEKEGMKKASSRTSSTRRISEASNTIRWLTERTVPFMNKRVISPLFQHFTQMLVSDEDRSELFQPIALDYAKSLKALMAYTPHLEHLEPAQWVRMVEICFNVILGDPIRESFTHDELMEEAATPTIETDDDMYVDEEPEEDDEAGLSRTKKGKGTKRTRRDPTPKPILPPRNVKRKGKALHTTVTSEQVEFASILSIVLASPVAPILSDDYPHLVTAIMTRLRRFLERYPVDSSLLYDYINILSSVLEHLSLNRKYEIEVFARSTWSALVGLWGTKDKHLKETLVVVLRHLFQFVVCPAYPDDPKLPPFDAVSGIGVLWLVLDAEAENKWGMDGLALDALRLDIVRFDATQSEEIDAFVAKTFRAGWNFDAEQALSWAILELRADCAGKLFQLSESMQHSTPIAGTSRGHSKRIKLENPITSLLQSIQTGTAAHVRNYHLQTLLFFIDRHWALVHDSQKQEIINILLQFIAVEDNTVQSWVFLNFAAIANAEASRKLRKPTDDRYCLDTAMWDSIWAHAIRRANAPIICRAACHAGQALLTSFYSLAPPPSQVLLTSSRVLLDIETFTKDMDVQGPSYPFDSVCIFLSHCLTIAGRDARLYRLHLEDSVLSWFIDSWKLSRIRSKMAPYTTGDILSLLETICSLSKRVDFKYRPLLPKSEIVESIVQENKTKVIRDFLLYAKVPPFFQLPHSSELPPTVPQGANSNRAASGSEKILVMPRGRERRISAFFLKTLESLVVEWENSQDFNIHNTAEMARQSLDISISAIIFESLLVLNGVIPNRQVLQNASKAIKLLVCSLNNPNWTTTERLLVAQGLEVLTQDGETSQGNAFCQALSQPGPDSGIKEQTLRRLLSRLPVNQQSLDNDRLHFLRLVWQNTEIQDALTSISEILRTLLAKIVAGSSGLSRTHAMDTDDKDGFGPIRTVNVEASTPNMRKADNDRPTRHTIEICVGVLACGPFLQSPSYKPSRDKELVQLILSSAADRPEIFCLICPIFFSRVRQGMFSLPMKYMDAFLDMFEPLLVEYTYGRSESFQCVLLDFLTSCLGVWRSDDSKAKDVHEKFSQLYIWMANALATQNMRSWILRDAFVRFMDKYLSEDPTQESWASLDDFEDEGEYQSRLPTSLLPSLNADVDMRVRFRAALVNARLYSLADRLQVYPMDMYDLMKDFYIKDVNNYEHMLTRILSLGNIMIVSSAVRRGPYWHLLETCIYSQQYVNHIEAILTGVSERLGLPSLSALFVAYASQIAYSIRLANADITTFPPHLLGYRDRRQSAEAAFGLFTPTNILNDGRVQFENHCKMLQKSVVDGLQDSFGEIVGLAIANWFGQSSGDDLDDLERHLKETLSPLDDFWSTFEQNLDRIVATILRCLGEQDFSENGLIVADLRAFDQKNNAKCVSTFSHLTTYRTFDTFKPHQPNLPIFSTRTLLDSLHWISSRLPNAFTKATTYHVLHLLMDKIHNTPLVNEQHRLINSITLWMAYRRPDLEDLTILNSVIHGATLLLPQSDLTRSAQSILEMALRYYRGLSLDNATGSLQDSHLPNFLLHICCIAHDFESSTNDRTISEIGTKLLIWIDQQAFLLSKIAIFQPVISRALAAWPHQPSSDLLPLYNEIMLSDLASILEDPHLSSNKFRLARRIKDQVMLGDDKEGQYSKTYFWRLKEYMPPSDRLQDEDVDAFTQLLSINHGKISGFNPEPLDLNSPRPRQRRMFKKKGTTDDALAPDAITLGLLMMLEDDDATHVSNAYHTLRLILAISSPEEPRFTPSEYRVEVNYLKCYKPSSNKRPVPNIQEMLLSDTYVESANDFKLWVSLLTVLFSDTLAVFDPFYGQLTSILTSDAEFAEQILPILVYTLLSLQRSKKLDHITDSLQNMLSTYFSTILASKNTDLACIRSIVDIVLHLRYFIIKTNDALAYNKWLNIDYTLLAQSSVLCGAYTTALLFVEIAADQKVAVRDNHTTEEVLYEIYAHIDEPDGFYGIQSEDLHQFLIKRLHHEKQWDKAFRFHGAAMEAGKFAKAEEGLMDSFHHFGFDHLAIDTLRNFPGDSSANSSASSLMNYKLAWRTETWDLPDQTSDASNAALYRSLRAVHRERDPYLIDKTIHSAFLAEMDHLRSLGSENLVEIRSVTRDLMCLGQILQWRHENIQELLKVEDTSCESWKEFISIDHNFEFSDLESLMATRMSLVRSIRQREERQQIGTMTRPFVEGLINIEKHCLLRLSEAARMSDQIQIALNSVIRAQRLEAQPTADVSEEFANVLWVHKEEKLAVRFLRHLLDSSSNHDSSTEDRARRAIWLSRLGTWTSEACLEKPAEIWARYFDPSIYLLEKVKEEIGRFDSSYAKIYRECAMFSERQYHSTLKSPDAIRWKVYVDRKTQEIAQRQKELESIPDKDSDHYKNLNTEKTRAQRLFAEDSEHFRNHNTLRDTSLRQAIDMHSRCLETSNDFDDDSAIRLCSLWLANFDDKSILDCIEVALERIPSRKFAFLAHQLTARLATIQSNCTDLPQENLQKLILRICHEHPFHILYQVYCLSDHADVFTGSRRQSAAKFSQSTQTERGSAAGNILDRLRVDEIAGQRVRDVEKLCDACLQWAKFPITKSSRFTTKQKGVSFKIPSDQRILNISNLRVPVSTARTPLDPTMQYKDCVWIQRYEPTFDTAGGINLPKINICHGSDGRRYKQLFKGEGNDDMRQDAVMEQVFDLVNGVLKRDRETRRRELNVRDYKVIPLASQAGLLEFVGNTSPLRDWLLKAHPIYRPQDMKPPEVYNAISSHWKKKPSPGPEQKLANFLQIRERFKPVLRHYFTEKHKNPIHWFQMRLCYTRSVATTSIVGHILGLGDRHGSNILMDNVSGEVVHIDLGIAFDQGKLLGIPEKVPFRMTADVVDGMGPSGTAGVFQRCAEETLRVLREESEVIMTVLEVFKHDPLHSWTASEYKVKQAQSEAPTVASTANDASRFNMGIGIDMSSGSADEAADRALSSVSRKLDKSLSVESTVNELLAEATDPMNLAALFVGWGSYM